MTERRSRATPILILVGLAMCVWGVVGVIQDPDNSHPGSLLAWVVAADVVHDLLLVPIVSVVAWAIARMVPERARTPLRTVIGIAALLVAVGWPFIAGYGRNPLVPSLLNRNYAVGVAVDVAVVALGGLLWALARRRQPPAGGDS